jgi:hypothetical protein
LHSATPTTGECLRLLDREERGEALTDDEKVAVAKIQARLPREYKRATPELLDALGPFCAYCEMRINDPTQLEHAIPKGPYPMFALTWDNFLPACIGCNSRKNNQPLRATVEASYLTAPPWTHDDYLQAIRKRAYRWPDDDKTHGFFAVRLFSEDRAKRWQSIPDDGSVADGVVIVKPASVTRGEVRASVPAVGRRNRRVAAFVVDLGGDARTAAMIALCGLRRPPVAGDASDRRTLYRTVAWFDALRALRPLVGSPAPNLAFGYVLALYHSGFYWTWLSVAELLGADVLAAFLEATSGVFPGTDATRLP